MNGGPASVRPRAAERPEALVIIGFPVAHSLSPRFQQAALDACALPVRYERLEVAPAALDEALRSLRDRRVGGNATIPHKEAMFSRASRRSATACATGAVNTFWWEQGELVGHNTDVDGVLATLRVLSRGPVTDPVLVLGAGGAAAAVLIALASHPETAGAPVRVVARSPERARALIARTGVAASVVHDTSMTEADWARAALVVNTTPIGMSSEEVPVAPALLSPGCAVFDLVYRAGGTAWIHAARAHGLVAEDGLRMLVEQGASAFECWFDRPAPRERMWAALGQAVPSPTEARVLDPRSAPAPQPD